MRVESLLAFCVAACSASTPAPPPADLALTASAARVAPGSQAFFTATRDGRYLLDAAWESSDPSVLSIAGRSDGTATVTGVAPGIATITATAPEGSGAASLEVADRRVTGIAVQVGAGQVAAGRDLPVTA
ncbi:MAG TPA: Ig-like domain-containing protein, partial [Kofleriaceae bacterium]